MKWIRPKGLIAFFALSAILLAFWYLFIDIIIKRHIEKTGTSLVGAKVELDKVDLTLFPLGLTLTGLQVANPDEPMKNVFEVARISFSIDGANLIRKKYIIEEMAVDGVRLNTERKSSGAVGRPKKAGAEEDATALLTFEVPDPKEVLEKEKLESIKLIDDLRADIEADKAAFEKKLSELPDEKKIKEYEERIESLKRSGRGIGGAIGKAGELLALKEEIQAELKRIDALRGEIKARGSEYRKKVEEAASAPKRDVDRIVKKYSFSAEGLSNLSSLFIGGKVREWVENGLRWREKVDRVVAAEGRADGVEVQKTPRGKGVDVQFTEYDPLPDFLIRKASVSVNIPAGDISGLITNITGDQDILGIPMKIRLSGERLKGLASALLEGEINRVVPDNPRDLMNLSLKGYSLRDFMLADNEYIKLEVKEALADLNIKAELKGESIAANIGSIVKSALMEAALKDEKNPVLETMAAALENVKSFNVDADVTGKLDDFKLKLASDLDRVLSNAAGGILMGKTAAFENSIKTEVFGKTEGQVNELNRSFEGLIGVDNAAGERLKKFNELLAEATNGAVPIPKLPF